MSKYLISLAGILAMLIVLSVPVLAIPESDIYSFRSAGRAVFEFDEFCSGSSCNRSITLNSYHNFSTDYYIIIRHHLGDVAPYDSFDVQIKCDGDALPMAFNTNDYESWNERGIISFKKVFANFEDSMSYDNTTIRAHFSTCTVLSASNLVVDGNSGYTTFYVEVIPVLLSGSVVTVQQLCESEARNDLIAALGNGIWVVLTNNVNFFYTFWIVVQTTGVILVVIGIPILVFLMIRWAVWKITGIRILGKRE